MIISENGTEYARTGVIIFTGAGDILCPHCGGKLMVHGTCRRKVKTSMGEKTYRLRVMKCPTCGKTHRELPAGVIPYKRMEARLIYEIASKTSEEHLMMTESSTWLRVKIWVAWFLKYAKGVLVQMGRTMSAEVFSLSGIGALKRFAFFVRLITNSGNWMQHRFT